MRGFFVFMANIKRLGKETLIYGTSTVLARLLNFCLVPFYTYYLPPDQYGIIATVFAAIALLNVVFLFGMDQSYLRFASEAENKSQIFRQCFVTVALNGLVLGGLLWLFHTPVSRLFGFGELGSDLLLFAIVILFLDVLNIIPFTHLRLERKAWYFASVRTLSIIVNVACNILFIAVLKKGVFSILWANIFASAASLLLLSPVWIKELFSKTDFFFKIPLQKQLVSFAWPFVPAGIASLLVSVIDKPLLVHLIGLEQVGIYQANFKIGVFMMLIVSMFDQAWRPFFLDHAKDKDAKETFARVFSCFFAVGSWVLLGLSLLMPTLIQSNLLGNFHLISPEYWKGLSVIPLVLTGYFFYGLYINFMVGPVLGKKTRVLVWITLLGASVSIGSNLILVPQIGILGAGWAVLLSYAVMALALFVFTQKVYPISYEYKNIALMILVIFITVGICWWMQTRHPVYLLPVKICLLAIYPLWMWLILKRRNETKKPA